jgi:drug/metabolite transporter (DMT)-like permease
VAENNSVCAVAERNGGAQRGAMVHILAAAVVAANAVGNSLLRAGLSGEPIDYLSPLAYLREFRHIWVILGIIVLIGWLLLELSLLSWADLTYVLPVTSAAYVLSTIIGVLVLGEYVSLIHWCGVLLILFGVVIVGRTKPLTPGAGAK